MKKAVIIISLLLSFGISQEENPLNTPSLMERITITRLDLLMLRLNSQSRIIALDHVIIEPPIYFVSVLKPNIHAFVDLSNQLDKKQQWYPNQPDKIKRAILTQVKNKILGILQLEVSNLIAYSSFGPPSSYTLPEDRVMIDISYFGREEAKVKNGEVILKDEEGYHD